MSKRDHPTTCNRREACGNKACIYVRTCVGSLILVCGVLSVVTFVPDRLTAVTSLFIFRTMLGLGERELPRSKERASF